MYWDCENSMRERLQEHFFKAFKPSDVQCLFGEDFPVCVDSFITQNPVSHTCTSALLDSPAYANPQSAGWVHWGLLGLFMPSLFSGCCHHSEYMVRARCAQKRIPPARTLPGTKQPDRNNCTRVLLSKSTSPETRENNGTRPRSLLRQLCDATTPGLGFAVWEMGRWHDHL